MGRWLDALKKRENGHEMNPQNPQKTDLGIIGGFGGSDFADFQKNSAPAADPPDMASSLPGESENGNLSEPDRQAPSRSRRVIPFPGREWTPDTKACPDDPERYAEALRLHGPASYGMMMRILQWGGTRAGQAEDALKEQGRIRFDRRGYAVLIEGGAA